MDLPNFSCTEQEFKTNVQNHRNVSKWVKDGYNKLNCQKVGFGKMFINGIPTKEHQIDTMDLK